jgi:hypothetical protein
MIEIHEIVIDPEAMALASKEMPQGVSLKLAVIPTGASLLFSDYEKDGRFHVRYLVDTGPPAPLSLVARIERLEKFVDEFNAATALLADNLRELDKSLREGRP